MISIPVSLSFPNLTMMSFAPAKICGGCQIRVPRSIHEKTASSERGHVVISVVLSIISAAPRVVLQSAEI